MDQPLSSNEQTKVVLFLLLLLPTFGLVVVGFLSIFYGMYMTKKQKDFSYIDIARKLFLACTKILFTASLLIGLIISYSEYVATTNRINESTKELVEYSKEKEEINKPSQSNNSTVQNPQASPFTGVMEYYYRQNQTNISNDIEQINRLDELIDYSTEVVNTGYSTYFLTVLLPCLIIPFIPILYIQWFHCLFYIPLSNHKDWVVANGIFSTTATKSKEPRTVPLITLPTFSFKKSSNLSIPDELVKLNKLKDDKLITQEEFDRLRKDLLG